MENPTISGQKNHFQKYLAFNVGQKSLDFGYRNSFNISRPYIFNFEIWNISNYWNLFWAFTSCKLLVSHIHGFTTDSDVPHLANKDFSYMRGTFLSIDRPYGTVLNFLHHNIGSSHVIMSVPLSRITTLKSHFHNQKTYNKAYLLILITYTKLYGMLLSMRCCKISN